MVKTAAAGDFDEALLLANEYLAQVQQEQNHAEEAIEMVHQLLSSSGPQENTLTLKRKEISEALDVSMDALRNWEMNGLLSVKRRENGYRVYTEEDIRRLKIIRSLRCANYSLEAILRMLKELSSNPNTNIEKALNTPKPDQDILSVCDRLIGSLQAAESNAKTMILMLQAMKIRFT
ncbi:MerR family transcriptional regulator [Gorillibacterium timonense]|uniref:MerR family transcriptional regulator n=1 Tax=Gorillibacterium timonense TaxID=1689269 RepID=UPI001F350CC0|nr:MerR family transcriptional regulator [Gorillibacterium timonense]